VRIFNFACCVRRSRSVERRDDGSDDCEKNPRQRFGASELQGEHADDVNRRNVGRIRSPDRREFAHAGKEYSDRAGSRSLAVRARLFVLLVSS
jgi:hypothetical protein